MEMDKDLSEMVSVDELKDWTFLFMLNECSQAAKFKPKALRLKGFGA